MLETQLPYKALERGVKVATKTLSNLFGEEKKVIPLSTKRQVDMFLSMDESTLNIIKQQRGEVEYQRYANTMLTKAKELYGD